MLNQVFQAGVEVCPYQGISRHDLGREKFVNEIYQDFYSNSPFTKIVESPPMTKQTLGSNMCLIYPTVDLRTNRLIVISCIDNLIKGTAGQAVQSMNIMCGYEETTGLTNLAIYP